MHLPNWPRLLLMIRPPTAVSYILRSWTSKNNPIDCDADGPNLWISSDSSASMNFPFIHGDDPALPTLSLRISGPNGEISDGVVWTWGECIKSPSRQLEWNTSLHFYLQSILKLRALATCQHNIVSVTRYSTAQQSWLPHALPSAARPSPDRRFWKAKVSCPEGWAMWSPESWWGGPPSPSQTVFGSLLYPARPN